MNDTCLAHPPILTALGAFLSGGTGITGLRSNQCTRRILSETLQVNLSYRAGAIEEKDALETAFWM